MNKMISKAGSLIVTVTVFLFAVFLIINFSMGSYFVCLILPIGFIMMTAGLHNECEGTGSKSVRIRQVRTYLQLRSARLWCNGAFYLLHRAFDATE